MAKITLLRNPPAAMGCPLTEGQTGSVDNELADTLIGMGIAAAVTSTREIKGVPNAPAIAAVEPMIETESTTETKSKKKS